MNELRERVSRLEDFVGNPQSDDAVSLAVQIARQAEQMASLNTVRSDMMRDMEERFSSMMQDFITMIDLVKENSKRLEDDINILKKAVATPQAMDEAPSKIKVPEPKAFNGGRNAKELENFLWDMEQYFKAAHIPDREKITITSMYLSGDAKLWWRTQMSGETRAGKPQIEDWETLKKELKDQFLPCNTAWIAREALKKLRQTNSVREYVREFSSLMLDIKDMSDADKLFNFLSGLQAWAHAELRRQGVKDLPSAIAAAEGLVDFRPTPIASIGDKKKGQEGKKGKGPSKDFKKSEG